MSKAVIALGTNIGDRIGNINLAVRAVSRLPGVKIIDGSSVYETEPVGVTDQPKFYNAAILVEASVSPAMLLGGCLGIEAAMGRVRGEKNGPRIVDLDLLLYENYKSEYKSKHVKHSRSSIYVSLIPFPSAPTAETRAPPTPHRRGAPPTPHRRGAPPCSMSRLRGSPDFCSG